MALGTKSASPRPDAQQYSPAANPQGDLDFDLDLHDDLNLNDEVDDDRKLLSYVELDLGSNVDPMEEAAPRQTYRRRWFGLVQLVLLNIVVSWDWLSFAPVISSAATYYSVSPSVLNNISIVFMFAFIPAAPVTMLLLNRGPKPSMTTAAALVLVGNWVRFAGSWRYAPDGGSGAGSFAAVVVGQMLCGLAQPFVLAAPTRYSELWFSPRGRVAATAVASLANPLGAAVGQLVNPFWVAAPEDISRMVLYVAVIATVSAVPTFFIPAAPPQSHVVDNAAISRPKLLPSLRIALSSLEVWLVLIAFWTYAAFFNSLSSILNQVMTPYGFSDDEAGIGGAILIGSGLVGAAVSAPILDRTRAFTAAIKALVPVVALSYLAFVWMPETRSLVGPYIVLAILGASSFSLVPLALEYLSELSHPASPEATSTVAWAGGQLLAGCVIYISDALAADDQGDAPRNMKSALVFQAVVALLVAPLPMALGLFGRADKAGLRR